MPDTTNLDMTLTEAKRLLGVKDGYTHEDVQQAYRGIARKYHPDKWLDKPESERKKATRIYERANMARRVLLNPTMAKPEPEPQHTEPQRTSVPRTPRSASGASPTTSTPSYENRASRYGGGAYGTGTQSHNGNGAWTGSAYGNGSRQSPTYGHSQDASGTYGSPASGNSGTRVKPEFNTPTHTYDNDNAPNARSGMASWASVGTSEAEREKFNTAKSFADKFGQTKDPAEADYAAEYARYASSRYHKASDVLHWTSSIATTLVTLTIAFVIMSQNGILQGMGDMMGASTVSGMQDAATGMAGSLEPLLALLIACVVKVLLYDMIIARQIEASLDRANAFLHGIPFAIGGVAMALFGWYRLSNAAFAWLALAFVIIGIAICVIHGLRHASDDPMIDGD